ncbi:MAG: hypothetical protein Kow0026_02930 [Oricola sp.]
MMKMFYNIVSRLAPTSPRGNSDWHGDPLSHPVIRKMSPDELADLPFSGARGHQPDGPRAS